MNILENELDFNEQEHKAGFHNTFTEHCHQCFTENKIIKDYKNNNIVSPYAR